MFNKQYITLRSDVLWAQRILRAFEHVFAVNYSKQNRSFYAIIRSQRLNVQQVQKQQFLSLI